MEERAQANHEPSEDPEPDEELRVLARLLGNAEEPAGEEGDLPAKAPPPPPETDRDGAGKGEPPRLLARRYEILRPLGEGRGGRAWVVRDHDRQGREMVLEILRGKSVADPAFAPRLRAYVERLRALTADAILRPRDAGRTELGLPYVTRDLVRGENLRRILDRKGVLSPRRALEIARQILVGLEHVHGAGLVHGGLGPQSVLLEERAPCTETNPFGVAVRLIDVGRTGLLASAEADPPHLAGDLRATAELLVELLLGTRPPTDAASWTASPHPPGIARLSAKARRLIDTALTVDPRRCFSTAREFRLAIEATPEWLPERGARRRIAILSAALVVLAGLIVVLLLREPRAVEAGPGAVTPAPLPPPAPSLRDELTRALARVEELTGELSAAEQELDRRRADETAWRERIAEGQRDLERVLKELRGATEERDLLALRLREARNRTDALETAARAAREADDPTLLTARTFDRILTRVEAGEGGAAQALLRSLEEDPVLAGGAVGGAAFLHAFTAAAAALERAAGTTDGLEAADLLAAARTEDEAAREGRRDFARAAAGWLAAGVEKGSSSARLAALDRALEHQRLALARVEAKVNERLDARWRAILDGDPDRPPAEVCAVAAWFADGRLTDFLARYARLVKRAGESDGKLDLDGLQHLASLPLWAEVVASRPDLAATPPGHAILCHDFARRWFDPAATGEALPPGAVPFPASAAGEAETGWRAALALRAVLVAPDSPFPGPPGTLAIYRALTPEGDVGWQVIRIAEDPDPPPGATRSRIVHQQFHDAAGKRLGERSLRMVQRGKVFFEEDLRQVEVLDLGRLDAGLVIERWEPSPAVEIPASLPVRAQEVAAFRKRLAEEPPRPCLVKRLGSKSTWYSPEFGLVRHEDPGRITRELIFASFPR